jgi:hypothetical protein
VTELRRGAPDGVAPWRGRGAARHPCLGGTSGGGGGAVGSMREGARGGAQPCGPAWPLGDEKAGWAG